MSSPAGSSPDDDFHMASIWCGQGDRDGLCEPGPTAETRKLPASFQELVCYSFKPDVAASCQGPNFNEPHSNTITTDRGNFGTPVYPGGFYAVLSVFASDHITSSAIAIRLFNSALFIALLAVAAWALPRNLRFPLIGGTLVTVIPVGAFMIASANPTSWSITSATVTTIAMLGYFRTSGRQRWILAAIAAVAILIGVSARGDSSVYVIIGMLAASVLGFGYKRAQWKTLILPVVVSLIAVVLYLSSPQATVTADGTAFAHNNPGMGLGTLLYSNLVELPQLWSGLFGLRWGLGWLDTALPAVSWLPPLVVFGAMVFTGLRIMNARKSVAMIGLGIAFVMIPLYALVANKVLVGAEVQPRYLFPIFLMLVIVGLVPLGRREITLSWAQRIVIIAALSVSQSLALRSNLQRYVGSHGSLNIDFGAQWTPSGPFSPFQLWILGSVLFAVTLIALAILMDLPRRRGSELPLRDETPRSGAKIDAPAAQASQPAASLTAAVEEPRIGERSRASHAQDGAEGLPTRA